MRDFYGQITAKIVAELEQGVAPWVKPWKTKGNATGIMPVNAYTGRSYSGMNVVLLWATQMERGYPSAGWMTYQQSQQAQAWVKKGEKATTVLFTKWVDDEETGKERPMVKLYSVFNTAQLENLHPAYLPEALEVPAEVRESKAMDIIAGSGVRVEHGGDRAMYIPSMDVIRLPPYQAFRSRDDYFATAYHELVHSVGHPSRLNRKYGKRFGDPAYQLEECVAELGSAFLCARAEMPFVSQSASYIDGWLKMMKAEPRAIFTAASLASQAADWLIKRTEPQEKAA
jgi:antirestriction protein ArdC